MLYRPLETRFLRGLFVIFNNETKTCMTMFYLTISLSVSAIAAAVYNFIRFCGGDKGIKRKTSLLSAACLSAVLLTELFRPDGISFQDLTFDFCICSLILLSAPVSGDGKDILAYPVVAAVLAILSVWFRILTDVGVFFIQILLIIIYMTAFIAGMTLRLYSEPGKYFRDLDIIVHAGEGMRLVFFCTVLWIAVLAALSYGLGAPAGALLLVSSLIQYAVFMLRSFSSRILFPFRGMEDRLSENLSAPDRATVQRGDSIDKALYERACHYMADKRPYLVPTFRLEDLAAALYTNKLYLSRAINSFAAKNFRQFVNHYRIMYSMELYAGNRRLKVVDMAELSGFNSVVSYNMAFKLVMNLTPSEWRTRFSQEEHPLPSMTGEGVP